MERPRNHIIEEESYRALLNLIPPGWVINKLTIDYGLDYLVQIFVRGKSTGNYFYIQLKGTDGEIINDSITHKIKSKHLEFYEKVITPILFVIYSTKQNCLWGIWINSMADKLPRSEGDKQSSITFKLVPRNRISHDFFIQLEDQFSHEIISKINIRSDASNPLGNLYQRYFKNWLKNSYSNEVTFDLMHSSKEIEIKYDSPESNKIGISIKWLNKTTRTVIDHHQDSRFLLYPNPEFDILPPELSEPMIALAIILKETDIEVSTEILLKTLPHYNGDLLTIDVCIDFGKYLIEKRLISHFKNLCKLFLDLGKQMEYQMLNSTILFFDHEREFVEAYDQNLVLGIDLQTESSSKAILCYNLANSYRSTQNNYDAIKYYQLCRKLDPSYMERYYWWREVAGVLFLLGHFKVAELCYKKSIDLGGEITDAVMFALLADCQFYQGKFLESVQSLREYFNSDSESLAEYGIKFLVSKDFVNPGMHLAQSKTDKSTLTKLAEEATQEGSLEKFGQVTTTSPLNGLAWFNYGVLLNSLNRPEEAFRAFLITAGIQRNDKEAMKNAFLIAFNLKMNHMAILIYAAGTEIHGDTFLNYLTDHFVEQNPSLIDSVQFTELLEKLKHEKIPVKAIVKAFDV